MIDNRHPELAIDDFVIVVGTGLQPPSYLLGKLARVTNVNKGAATAKTGIHLDVVSVLYRTDSGDGVRERTVELWSDDFVRDAVSDLRYFAFCSRLDREIRCL